MENHSDNVVKLEMSPRLREDLATAATWGRIIAIMGFCSCFFSLLFSFKRGTIASGIISVAFSVVLYIFLLKFGTNVKKGVDTNDQQMLTEGLFNLKIYFKIIGYLIVICIIIFVLAIAFGLLGALVKFR